MADCRLGVRLGMARGAEAGGFETLFGRSGLESS